MLIFTHLVTILYQTILVLMSVFRSFLIIFSLLPLLVALVFATVTLEPSLDWKDISWGGTTVKRCKRYKTTTINAVSMNHEGKKRNTKKLIWWNCTFEQQWKQASYLPCKGTIIGVSLEVVRRLRDSHLDLEIETLKYRLVLNLDFLSFYLVGAFLNKSVKWQLWMAVTQNEFLQWICIIMRRSCEPKNAFKVTQKRLCLTVKCHSHVELFSLLNSFSQWKRKKGDIGQKMALL